MSDPLSRIAVLAERWRKTNDVEREMLDLPLPTTRAALIHVEARGRVDSMDHVLKQIATIIPNQLNGPPRKGELVARIDTYLQGSSSESQDHSNGCDLLTEARDELAALSADAVAWRGRLYVALVALEDITSVATEVRAKNTPEFMEYLAKMIEKAKTVWRLIEEECRLHVQNDANACAPPKEPTNEQP